MGRKIKSISTVLSKEELEVMFASMAIMDAVFQDMPEPRREKCQSLYFLASKVGAEITTHEARKLHPAIVELGTYHGNGAIALTLGAKQNRLNTARSPLHVFTVDDYSNRKGWAGEEYVPEDRDICLGNFMLAGVEPHMVYADVSTAAATWNVPILLLFWDCGCGEPMRQHILAWDYHVIRYGIIAMHDTYSGEFGAEEFCNELIASKNYQDYQVYPGGVHTVRKVWSHTHFYI